MSQLDRLKKHFDQSVCAALADRHHGLPKWTREIDWQSPESLRFVICGTGFWASVFLHYAGGIKVLGVVDDTLAEKTALGYPCMDSDQFVRLAQADPDVICINSGQSDAGFNHFERLGLERGLKMLNPLQAFRALETRTDIRVADWVQTIINRADEFHETAELLSDTYSAETLYSVLLYHIETDRDHLLSINRPPDAGYFRSGLFEVGSSEVFVDGGAYTGDSVQTFIQACHGRFNSIHAYEPDPTNFELLEQWKADQRRHPYEPRIHLHPAAIGHRVGSIRFNSHSNAGSFVPLEVPAAAETQEIDNSIEIPCVTLDEAIEEPVSLLKLDIEGQELNALRGATGHLHRSRPNLAVCAYHLPTDLIDLPRFLTGLDKDYRLGIRHHSNVRYDTILYAY